MANNETVESLSKKIEMMQARFDVCDKHRRMAEDIVAEQRLRIKELERENESLRANVMILETAVSKQHNEQDVLTIMRLTAEKAELERQLKAPHESKLCAGANDGYAYLNSVSPAAKEFVVRLVEQGEANLYHSIMSVMQNRPALTANEFVEFYLKKYGLKRPYLLKNQALVVEIVELCWKNFHSKN